MTDVAFYWLDPTNTPYNLLEKLQTNFRNRQRPFLHSQNQNSLRFNSKTQSLQIVRGRNISQFPLYNNGKFAGLLTTDAIARWLGSVADEDIISITETKAIDVYDCSEQQDNHEFLSKHATCFDAVDRFDQFEAKGSRLEALLITESGKKTESVVGLIAYSDLAQLIRIVQSK